MTIDVAISLSGLSPYRASRAESILSLVPALTEGRLVSSDLAVRRSGWALVGVLRFQPGANAGFGRARFWCARVGASWVPMTTMSTEHATAFLRRFEACDVRRCDVDPAVLAATLRELLSVLELPAPAGPTWPPVLSLDPNGPGWQGFEYDPATARLFIPGALAPIVGDVLLLELRTPEVLRCRACVVSVHEQAEAGPGRFSGFQVALGPDAGRVRDVLAARCEPRGRSPAGRRASPRFRVAAGARVTALGEEDAIRGHIANLSLGGAFMRSDVGQNHLPVGTPLQATFQVSDGVRLAARGTVVHAAEEGFGIRFEHDDDVQAQLTNLLARLVGRSRRVLVIDDDALARSMLADAFESEGFEVLTAPDAMSGLQTLIDQLFTLDLLVTDVVMQGFDGVELLRRIRHDGNEADLPILAVTATLTPQLEEHLLRAGADAVAVKSIGPRLLVQAAEAVLARRGSALVSGQPRRAGGIEP